MNYKRMDDIQVIFDVGARDTEYPIEYPDAICHLFEPNHKSFDKLQALYGDNENVLLNNYGLGIKEENLPYDPYTESCVNGTYRDYEIPIKTLNWYIETNNIKRLDFLKIDTEAMDFLVLKSGQKAIDLARYIQYEYWDNRECFHDMLETEFEMTYIGERNVLCKRK